MGNIKEGGQQNVHICKQENHSKTPRQDCGSKGDQGLVWQTEGPVQVQQRHQPEEATGDNEFTPHQELVMLQVVQSCHAWINRSPGRWNGSFAEDGQETSNHRDSQRSQ